MKDELIEKLAAADPATEERIAREARALGDLPTRISAGEFGGSARRLRVLRRRIALALAAAVIAVGVGVPLVLLSPLGGKHTGPGGGEGWVTVGALDDVRSQGVVYVSNLRVFVLAPAGEEPYALSAISPHRADLGERVLYCRSSGWFVAPHFEQFDAHGIYAMGPATNGLRRVALRVVDGSVEVNPSDVSPGPPRGTPTGEPPAGPFCGDGTWVYELQPGFAAPPGANLPPIAVGEPQAGMLVSSPAFVAGTADVFEATVSIRILDQNGNIIADTFTTATCGTGCRGDYSTNVRFAVDHSQPGLIQVFEASAKDGSMINVVEIPVTLVPDEQAAAVDWSAPRELPEPTRNDLRSEFVSDQRGYRFWPRSAPVEPGVAYRFDTGHCGLDFLTDFDRSFWDPVSPNEGEPPTFFYNQDVGALALVAPDEALFRSSTGIVVRLSRIDGPVVTQLCA